jgi:hypothetical protein
MHRGTITTFNGLSWKRVASSLEVLQLLSHIKLPIYHSICWWKGILYPDGFYHASTCWSGYQGTVLWLGLVNLVHISLFFFGRTIPKSCHSQNFLAKMRFFLKINSSDRAPFSGQVTTSMRTGYTFNAPGEKYRQLGELWLNLCGGIVASTTTLKNWKKNDWSISYQCFFSEICVCS